MSPHTADVGSQVEALGQSLTRIVDVLIPGDQGWPAASDAGVQHAILMRLLDKKGDAGLAALSGTLAKYGFNNPRGTQDEIDSTARLEAEEPQLFLWLRSEVNYAYYESPVIVALIDRSGTPYRLIPHRDGYDLARFDESTQTPRHGRGRWTPTGEVKPVDISGLELQTRTTEKWGLNR